MATASFHPSPGKPKLRLPRGTCDTHFHVFGPRERFPYAPDRSYTPAAAGKGNYVGVALVPVDVTDDELGKLDRQGFRGARFHFMEHLGTGSPIEEVLEFGKRLAGIGWHLQIHLDGARVEALAPALKRSPVLLVGNPQRFYGFSTWRSS